MVTKKITRDYSLEFYLIVFFKILLLFLNIDFASCYSRCQYRSDVLEIVKVVAEKLFRFVMHDGF